MFAFHRFTKITRWIFIRTVKKAYDRGQFTTFTIFILLAINNRMLKITNGIWLHTKTVEEYDLENDNWWQFKDLKRSHAGYLVELSKKRMTADSLPPSPYLSLLPINNSMLQITIGVKFDMVKFKINGRIRFQK